MNRMNRLLWLPLILCALLAAVGCGCQPFSPKNGTTTTPPTTTAPPTVYVTVIADGATDYTVIRPARSQYADISTVVSGIREAASAQLGVSSLRVNSDAAAEAAHEILVGDTTRAATVAAAARLAAAQDEASYHWLVAEDHGKIVLYADSDVGYRYLLDHFLTTYIDGNTLRVPEGCFDLQSITYTEYEQILAKEEEAELATWRETVLAGISGFRLSDFGRVATLETIYEKPPIYPTAESHPRILITPETIDGVRANLTHPENAAAYKKYLALSERRFDGKLPASSGSNMDTDMLAAIEAKALRYLMTGEDLYGYEAIYAIKNYIRTLFIPAGYANATRLYSYTMYIAAVVYDWCYDLLTMGDRYQLVAGIETLLAPNLEVGFPPDGQGTVNGHGVEEQIYRDWLAVAIATYDEFPDIYEYVAGRLFQDFTDAGEFYMQSGSHWQGASYGPKRYYFMLVSEALVRAMTGGEHHLFSDLLQGPAITFANYVRPDGQIFRIGDVFGESGTSFFGAGSFARVALLASNLYSNPSLKRFAREASNGFSAFTYIHDAMTPAFFLAVNDPTVAPEKGEDFPLVLYNGSPLGSIIARSAWDDEDAVAVYMKIGEAYSANHEHQDAGSFMIHYKGILASDSGYYNTYGTKHDRSYNKQTISSNSLLVFNPNLSDNGVRIYSGGQTIHKPYINSEKPTLAVWLNQSAGNYAEIIGHGYATETAQDGEERYLWSYLAGDLTNAYDSETVDEINRYMLSIMTESDETPMLFVVYDRITAVDASFKKTFLLHTQEEPTVDAENDTATVTNTRYNGQLKKNNSGKLHVQSLLTDVTYTVIGGEGNQFNINGNNYPIEDNPSFSFASGSVQESGWGRIEISPATESKSDRLLTVMYVTDAENGDALIRASEISADAVVGAELLGKVAVFPRESGDLASTFSFTTASTEADTLDYHVTGLGAGQWEILVNGRSLGYKTADEGGILTFTASGGTVTMRPAFARIRYVLNGGTASGTLPETYPFGTALTLPTDLVKFGSEFIGWYVDPSLDEEYRIREIPADARDEITLYAKWNKLFDVVVYESNEGKINGEYDYKLIKGESLTLPTDVTADGMLFVGWYTTPDFAPASELTVIPAARSEGDVTVYARFERIHAAYGADNLSSFASSLTDKTSVLTSENGLIHWSNPSGTSTLLLNMAKDEGEDTLTFSFDLALSAEHPTMDYTLRMRPSARNMIDTPILTIRGGKICLGEYSAKSAFLDEARDSGVYRITLVLSNDNAGLAAGKAAPEGHVTTADEYLSTVTVRAFVNGTYAAEREIKTYITFGEHFDFTKTEGGTPISTELQRLQLFTQTNTAASSSIRLGNLRLVNGAHTVGGKYFVVLGDGVAKDESWLVDGELKALPEIDPAYGTLLGWYTDPDFKGDPITNHERYPRGTVFYASVDSLYDDIVYEMADGTIVGEYPTAYLPGTELALPTEVTKDGSTFLGWYDSLLYTKRVTAISAESTGTVTVYARYATPLYHLAFDGTAFSDDSARGVKPGKTDGVRWVAPSEENQGNGWLETSNADCMASGQYINLSSIRAYGRTLTISFDIKMTEPGAAIYSLRLRHSTGSYDTYIFRIDNAGNLFLGKAIDKSAESGNVLGKASSAWQTVTLKIEALGDGNLTVAGYLGGEYVRTVTILSPSGYFTDLTKILRAQFYTDQRTGLSETAQAYTTYFDNILVNCE